MVALHRNGTWDLVPLPLEKYIVACKWVYIVKFHPDGSVDHLKARLVAKVYTKLMVLTMMRHSLSYGQYIFCSSLDITCGQS